MVTPLHTVAVAQLVERWIVAPAVAGSIPVGHPIAEEREALFHLPPLICSTCTPLRSVHVEAIPVGHPIVSTGFARFTSLRSVEGPSARELRSLRCLV